MPATRDHFHVRGYRHIGDERTSDQFRAPATSVRSIGGRLSSLSVGLREGQEAPVSFH